MKNQGRKIGSINKLNNEGKKALLSYFNNDLEKLQKLLNYIPIDERFQALRPFIKMLTTGSDEIAIKTREAILDSLEPEFKKLPFYLRLMNPEGKAKELRQYLNMLPKEDANRIIKNLK